MYSVCGGMWWCDEVIVCLYGHSQCHILLELEGECGLRVGWREGRRGRRMQWRWEAGEGREGRGMEEEGNRGNRKRKGKEG